MDTNVSSQSRLHELIDPMMEAIARIRPVFSRLFAGGDQDIGTFTKSFFSATLRPIQDRSDYIEMSSALVEAAQGRSTAERYEIRLRRSPVINTANHLCLECLPLTVQSMILAGLEEDPEGVLPVETCGSIPADNVCFPSGLLLARRSNGKMLRVPVLELSKRQRRQMTWLLAPFDKGGLERASLKVAGHFQEGTISVAERNALMCVLEELLAAPDVLERSTFREQVSVAVPRMWETWFTLEARKLMPALAYTPSESVRIPLLIKDVQTADTLVHRVLFDPILRREVMTRLDGISGCWTQAGRRSGSALFWEIGPDGKTAPMTFQGDSLENAEGKRVHLEPESLADGLRAGRLLPTNFLILAVAMARGLIQVGGFNQIDYLATMQQQLSRALAACGYSDWAACLSAALPLMLTAGLGGVAVAYGVGEVQSAGAIEMMAHGGLTPAELDRLKRLGLREAMALELPAIARSVLGESGGTIPEIRDLVEVLEEKLLVFRL